MNRIIRQTKVMEPETIEKNGTSSKNRMSRKNIKLFTLLAFIMLFGFRAMAQDVIILKNGDEIKSLVQEIGTEYVKYKKFDNQTGPVYNVAILEIFMIKYENGSKDVFNASAKSQETKTEQSVQQSIREDVKQESQKQQEPANLASVRGKVYLDGKVITHEQVVNILASNDLLTNAGASDIYKSGHSRLQTANAFGWIGLTSLGAGLGFLIASFAAPPREEGGTYYYGDNSYGTGVYICCGVSLICSMASFTISASGNNRINDAINTYNTSLKSKHSSDVSMNFGITRSGGIGFTLNF